MLKWNEGLYPVAFQSAVKHLEMLCVKIFRTKKKSVSHNVNGAKNFSVQRCEMKTIVSKCLFQVDTLALNNRFASIEILF